MAPYCTGGFLDQQPCVFYFDDESRSLSYCYYTADFKTPGFEPQWTQIQEESIAVVQTVDRQIGPQCGWLLLATLIFLEKKKDTHDSAQNITVPHGVLARQAALYFLDWDGYATDLWRKYGHVGTLPNPPDYVLMSTASGIRVAETVFRSLVMPTIAIFHPDTPFPEVVTTVNEESVTVFARQTLLPQANEGKKLNVVLLSGDGGILEIFNALLAEDRSEKYEAPLISIIPVGTGNALAHSCRIIQDNDVTYGLRAWFSGKPKELRLFKATFSSGARVISDEGRRERSVDRDHQDIPTIYGAIVCSWGLHAALVADSDTEWYRRHGADRFKMAANEALFPSDGSPPHSYKGEVYVMREFSEQYERIGEGAHGYVLASAVTHLEQGFAISPHGRPPQGKMHLVRFGPIDGQQAMEIMKKAYAGGQHVNDDRVQYIPIERLRIEFGEEDGRWRRVCIDGKIVKVEQGGWIEVRANQTSVISIVSMI
ncbi:diacylglycerol kinase [Lecanosticta acicola]|uniref:Diacylglycerol kinase n=1 Tax=Lecanosticta acicola TaxID=111012 RepID=A0AAI8YVE2_9PEZI|nr:diacylglycerol kinase [Lecanosticta acicola]